MFITDKGPTPERSFMRPLVVCAALTLAALCPQALAARAQEAVEIAAGWGACLPLRAQGRQKRREVREVTSTRTSVQQGNSSADEVQASWSTDGEGLRVRAKNVRLTDDAKGVQSVEPNGYLFMSERGRGGARELRVEPGANGDPSYVYSKQGRQREFDSEAREWFARTLLEFVRNSGYEAERRVDSLAARQGVQGVLDEVTAIPSDFIKRIYLQKLVERHNVDAANLERVIEQAGRQLTSDFELTEFLLSIKGQFNASKDVRAAFLKAVERLRSDSDRGKVLSAVSAFER